jgi:hypothetical protein
MGLFCVRKDGDLNPQPLYGVSYPSYLVSGKIRASGSGLLLGRIEMRLSDTADTQHASTSSTYDATFDTLLGYYSLELSGPQSAPYALRLRARDVDGTANGSFVTKDTLLRFDDSDMAGYNFAKTVDLELDSAQ